MGDLGRFWGGLGGAGLPIGSFKGDLGGILTGFWGVLEG